MRSFAAGRGYAAPLLKALYGYSTVVIDRAAIILRYKQPVVDWINEADPYDRDPGTTLDHVNEERTVYLIEERYVDSPADFERWLTSVFLSVLYLYFFLPM